MEAMLHKIRSTDGLDANKKDGNAILFIEG